MRFLLFLLGLITAAPSFAQLATPAGPSLFSNSGRSGGAATAACQLAGGVDCQMVGQVRGNAGTASLPSFASPVGSGSNDGLYFPSTSSLGMAVEGSLRLHLTTTGFTSTVVLQGPAGTATLPTFSFTGDTNNGIYQAGADVLAVTTNGVQRLNVSTTAINTAEPIRGQTVATTVTADTPDAYWQLPVVTGTDATYTAQPTCASQADIGKVWMRWRTTVDAYSTAPISIRCECWAIANTSNATPVFRYKVMSPGVPTYPIEGKMDTVCDLH